MNTKGMIVLPKMSRRELALFKRRWKRAMSNAQVVKMYPTRSPLVYLRDVVEFYRLNRLDPCLPWLRALWLALRRCLVAHKAPSLVLDSFGVTANIPSLSQLITNERRFIPNE